MSTRNIKDAKDLTTGELIYFKSHAQATFMSDGRTVEEAVSEMSAVDTSNLATKDELAQKQDIISDIDTIRNNAANYKGTVTSIKINGTNKNPSNGVVDLGTVITAHQNISGKVDKTLNAKSLEAITIKTSNSDTDMSANVTAIKEYTDNLTALGVDVTKGFNVPVKIDGSFCGCLTGRVRNIPGADGYFLGRTIFYVGAEDNIKDIYIHSNGYYGELVNIKNDNVTYILDSNFFKNIHDYMLNSNLSIVEIKKYYNQLIDLFEIQKIYFIFLKRNNIKKSFEDAFKNRGFFWESHFKKHLYEKLRMSINDDSSEKIYEYEQKYQELIESIFDNFKVDKTKIITDEEKWDEYLEYIMNDLGLFYYDEIQDNYDYALNLVKEQLKKYEHVIDNQEYDIVLPWKRMFEVEIIIK